MQNCERQLIQKNIKQLARALNFAEVSKLLLIRKTFNQSNIDHIKTYNDDYTCSLMLLTDLQTRGPNAFQDFVDVLKMTDCTEALELISLNDLTGNDQASKTYTRQQDSKYPLGLQSIIGKEQIDETSFQIAKCQNFDQHDSSDSRPNTLKLHQDSSIQKKTQPSNFNWQPFSNSLNETVIQSDTQQNSDKLIGAIGQDSSSSQSSQTSTQSYQSMVSDYFSAARSLKVRKAEKCHDDLKQDYKFTSRPRGPCLIINNVDFESEMLPRRSGSDEDSRILQDVFRQIGFEVHHERNLTASVMKKTFSKLVSACRQEHDALFLIILSHGSESGIYGIDGVELDLNDVMSYFDNRRCKIMIGKPKVFIVQSCKGRVSNYLSSEESTDSAACSPDSPPQMHGHIFTSNDSVMESRSSQSTNSFGLHAIRTDMLLCFSCVPGYAYVQDDASSGPGLGKVLAYYIETKAWEKDFQRILAMVCRDIERRSSSGGFTEAIEINCLGWSKYLYLNPGIYR